MSNIIKNYLYNFLYQLFVLIVPIVLTPYLARVLGAEMLGVYSYIYSVCSVVSTITMLGTYNYGARQIAYIRDNNMERTCIYWELFLLRIGLGSIGIVAYILFALCSRYFILFVLFSGWLIAGILDPSWFFVGIEDMRPTVIKNFVVKIISVFLIFVIVKTKADLWKYCIIMGSTMLISTVVLLFQMKKYLVKTHINIRNIEKHIKGSINLFLPQVATIFYLQIDKIMIKYLSGNVSQVSYYDQAEKIVTIPLTFITVLSTVMMPHIANEYANKHKKNIKKLLLKACRISLFMSCPMMIGLIVISDGFIPWYLGTDFVPASTALVVISPIIISNSLSSISGNQYFTATNQISILMKSYISAAVINIIMNIIFIPPYGFVGAAIATLFSSYTSVAIQYYYLNKQVKTNGLLKNFIKYFVVSIFMGICTAILKSIIPVAFLSTILEVLCGFVIYLIILIILKDEMVLYLIKKIGKIIR